MSQTHAQYAGLYIDGNADVQAVTAAAVKIDDWDGAYSPPLGGLVADAGAGDKITIQESGIYRVHYSLAVAAMTTAKDLLVEIVKTDKAAAESNLVGGRSFFTALTGQLDCVLTGQAIAHFEAGETVHLSAASSGAGTAGNVTFTDGWLFVERLS